MMSIAAQVSLYPLRTEHLGPVIEQAVTTIRFHCHNLEHEDGGMMVNYRVV